MLTWRGAEADRLEQVRLNISGSRVRAYGRIISAATDEHEAFSVSYELVTTESGVTRRLSIRMLKASGESQLDISRDLDGRWMVQSPDSAVHSDFGGAETIDVELSPFFKTVPIRRFGLARGESSVQLPVVYLSLPSCSVDQVDVTYEFRGSEVGLIHPEGQATLLVDDEGLATDFRGIATRI